MAKRLKLGPADHGRALTLEEYLASDCREGYRYELIEGKLDVSPPLEFPVSFLEHWINRALNRYAEVRPDVIDFSWSKSCVLVPGGEGMTAARPDAAAYADFPFDAALDGLHWQDVSPLVVAEVIDAHDPDKDLVRKVRLYRLVPSIREYWVIDPRPQVSRPTLVVRRRSGNCWHVMNLPYGSTYATPLLPGFELIVDPRR